MINIEWFWLQQGIVELKALPQIAKQLEQITQILQVEKIIEMQFSVRIL